MNLRPNIVFVLFGGPMLAWLLYDLRHNLRAGTIAPFAFFKMQFRRADRPVEYWSFVALEMVTGAIILIVILLSGD